VCGSPDQAPHPHTLGPKVRDFISDKGTCLGLKVVFNVNQASDNTSEVVLGEVLADVSSSTGQLQTAGRRNFDKDWGKEFT
jgi:hypothetical protein